MAEVLERKRHLIIAEQSRNDRLRCRAEYYEYVLRCDKRGQLNPA